MRIHRLTLEGIGPYATRQDLDFDELTANGLFLFTGPTGAGKTTILDAVVFALYGTVPGARGGDGKRDKRARERIVSDLRTLDTQPKVELEFTAGGRRFVVIRSPDHERPKSRGEGTTVAKASATLEERVGDDWVPRSTDFYEISTELQTVIGMNAEQFAQVVLLPQGEFAGFLRASVGDRRKVLERLFQVDRYQSAEDWFRAKADEAKTTLAEARSDLEHVVERLAGALGDAAGPDEVLRGLTTPDEIGGWIAARGIDAQERVERAALEASTRKAQHALIDQAHVRAAQLAELTVALDRREDALAVHAARLPKARTWMAKTIDDATAQDDAAWEPAARAARGRAAELTSRVADEERLPQLAAEAEVADAAAATASAAADAADAAAAESQRAIAPARVAAESGARAEAASVGLRRELVELRSRIDAAGRRARLSAQLSEIAARLDAATTAATTARQQRDAMASDDALDHRARDLAARRQDLGGARAQLEAEVRATIAELEGISADRAKHAALSDERDVLAAEVRVAQEAHLEARGAYLSAREARLDAMAAELAAGLEAGEACPVCGAVDHPHPAGGGSGHDLREAENAADAVATQRQAVLSAAQGALDTCTGRLASYDPALLATRAAASTERAASRREALAQIAAEEATVATEGEALRGEVAAKRAAQAAAQAAEALVSRIEREHASTREALATATAQAGDGPPPSPADADVVEAQLIRIDAEIAAAADARDRIATLEAAVEHQRGRSAQARAAVAEHQQAARGLRAQATALRSELAAFRGEHDSVAAAAKAAAQHAYALEAAVQLLDHHRTAVVERDTVAVQLREIADRDTAAAVLTDEDPTDVQERVTFRARRRAESAELATDAAAELREATRCQAAVADAESSLRRALAALGPAAEAAERVIRLDATVRGTGDNLRKISLATYVLAARLEEVAAAATGHLLRMSSGRYELLHHDDRYGGGPAGLGLRVRDGWTGEERDTATLSGGEAFYASLALALGLAEVVTNEAGGRPLDTLLVDEGFGSLDADTLEEVLGELDQLRAAGRSIGLVSHVPALAERIPAQLRVTPGRAGSTAQVVVGATV